ncbi:restriction endonuclease subunit S [Streptomyces thermocoprophilus]|uniref:Restriction endonuclease subunit S n=1 Tax=Streptomyces thermocoprophilus TaxID=78356 RepID=A0ABV5VBI5_9ACTN
MYRIKDVVHINRKALPEDTDPSFRFRYIDISAVNSFGKVAIPTEDTTFANSPSRARRLAPAGSVAVSTVRTYLRAVATVPATSEPLVFSTGFAVLEAGPQIDSRFLAYYCQSQPFIDDVVARSTGVSYPAINPSEIGNLRVTLPSLEEQRRVADFLDTETARIDELVRNRSKQATLLAERDFASLSEALIPGILTASSGEGLYPWLPAPSDDRPLVRLGYICQLQNGLTVDGKRDVTGDAVTRPYLRVANVQSGRLELDSVSEITVPRAVAQRATLRVGDVLMTEGGDLDKLGRGTVWNGELPDCLHQNHVFALRPDETILDGRYLALMTRTVHGRCYFESTGSKTTNLASTNSSKILGFPIPLPSLNSQRELISRVHKDLQATSRLRAMVERQAALLAERRQALITAAVTGQFDVSTASGRNVTEGVSA